MTSIGYVIDTIHLQPELAFGKELKNSADIFFDFNAPIKANTALNTIVPNVSITEH